MSASIDPRDFSAELEDVVREANRARLQATADTQQQLADALNQLDAAAGAMEAKDREIRRLTGEYLELLNLLNDRQ